MNCETHPAIPGVGVCVACRRVLCDSCTTLLQGRNTCSTCLGRTANLGESAEDGRSSPGWSVLVALATLASTVGLWGAVYGAGFLLYVLG